MSLSGLVTAVVHVLHDMEVPETTGALHQHEAYFWWWVFHPSGPILCDRWSSSQGITLLEDPDIHSHCRCGLRSYPDTVVLVHRLLVSFHSGFPLLVTTSHDLRHSHADLLLSLTTPYDVLFLLILCFSCFCCLRRALCDSGTLAGQST